MFKTILASLIKVALVIYCPVAFLTSGCAVNAAQPSRTGIALERLTGSHCWALAPRGWRLEQSPAASAVDLTAPDNAAYAGWGVVEIDRAMQPYYGPMYGDPATSMATMIELVMRAQGDSSGMRYTSAPQWMQGRYFVMRSFASARKAGLVFYHIYPVSSGVYIESVYISMTDRSYWRSLGPVAVNVAASIRASTQLMPPPPSAYSNKSKSGKSGGKNDFDPYDPSGPIDKSYNMQLGWQDAHTSDGTNYIMTPEDYKETGPEGPGYYAQVGNHLEKMELGWEG